MISIASLLIILQVIFLDGILSIDNLAALGVIASSLPKNQQRKVLTYGLAGGIIGRGLMLLLAGVIIYYGWLKLLAVAYLLYLCGVHFFNWSPLFNFKFKNFNTFWRTVIQIEIADLAFSLDNVTAVVAITSNIVLVIIGVLISMFIIRFAAQLFIRLIDFEPLLEHAAYVLIFAIAIELFLRTFGVQVSEVLQFCISVGIMAGFTVVGQYMKSVPPGTLRIKRGGE